MLREKVIEDLKLCQEADDIEEGHRQADDILCALLDTLGYEDVVAEWKLVKKWYA